MFSDKIPAMAAVSVCAVLASACANTPSASQQQEKHEIVSRWTRCIQHFSSEYTGPVNHIALRAQNHCEGHRRDIVATYPRHLKKRIESLLSERAFTITSAQAIKTTGSNSWNASKGTQLETLRMRLMEARQTDL